MASVTLTSFAASVRRHAHDGLDEALRDAADAIEDDIVTGMFASGGGRVYKRYPGPYSHEASQPGQPPAVDTQELVKSIDVEHAGELAYEVGMRDKKAPLLEFGGEKMQPRPSLGPAVDREARRIEARVAQALRKRLS